MKTLFKFFINKEVEEEEKIVSKDEAGNEVTTSKKIKKEKPIEITLIKPSRYLYDEEEIYYGVKLAEGIKKGMMTRQQLSKRYVDDGGDLAKKQEEYYNNIYLEIYTKQNEFQRLNLIENHNEDQIAEINKLKLEIIHLTRKLQDFDSSREALFGHSAENRARIKTILWWILQLAHYQNEAGEVVPYFGAGTVDDKFKVYDSLEEKEDIFFAKLANKCALYVSFWYHGKTATEEDFKKFEQELKQK